MNEFPRLSRRDFFKGLIALGVVATIPQAKMLPIVKPKTIKGPLRYYAIWQPPGQKAKLTMFAGDLPDDVEVVQAGAQYIIRFPRYPDDFKSSMEAHKHWPT